MGSERVGRRLGCLWVWGWVDFCFLCICGVWIRVVWIGLRNELRELIGLRNELMRGWIGLRNELTVDQTEKWKRETHAVVVHSCKLQGHIKHEWEGYLGDVGLGRYPSTRHPTPSWQNHEGLAPQSGQTLLNGGVSTHRNEKKKDTDTNIAKERIWKSFFLFCFLFWIFSV